jgi:hypothetical protein
MPPENQLARPVITKAELDAKIERAAQLQAELDKTKPIEQELKGLKYDIQEDMQALGSRRTDPMAGYYGLRTITKTLRVTDPDATARWLEENTMDARDYYTKPTLDEKAIAKLQVEVLDRDGELIPGTEEVETESFSLRRAK